MSNLDGKTIIIIGAGVAGLTAARALSLCGARVTVLERADAIREVGAGLQISPNGGQVLENLGLGAALDAVSLRNLAVELNNRHGGRVARLDLLGHRPDQIFRLVHRARLIEVLAAGARAAGADIRLNAAVESILLNPAEIGVNGEVLRADLIIGADGLHSPTRAALNGRREPFFTGQTAWRAVIPDTDATPVAQVFMGAGQHLVSYPLAGGLRNIVAVRESRDWQAEGWSHRDDPAHLRAAFEGFGGPVPGWLARIEELGIWGLFRHPVAERWHAPGIAILGDAAHPTLPFMAQGAVMALEDVGLLSAHLNAEPDQNLALSRWQAARRPRVLAITEAANKNARNYHLSGPVAALAHAGLRMASKLAPDRLTGRFDWLYDFDATTV